MFDDFSKFLDDIKEEVFEDVIEEIQSDTYEVECPTCNFEFVSTPGLIKCPNCNEEINFNLEIIVD